MTRPWGGQPDKSTGEHGADLGKLAARLLREEDHVFCGGRPNGLSVRGSHDSGVNRLAPNVKTKKSASLMFHGFEDLWISKSRYLAGRIEATTSS
jgi:hypothetical protein